MGEPLTPEKHIIRLNKINKKQESLNHENQSN
jgi:hypothetical protein